MGFQPGRHKWGGMGDRFEDYRRQGGYRDDRFGYGEGRHRYRSRGSEERQVDHRLRVRAEGYRLRFSSGERSTSCDTRVYNDWDCDFEDDDRDIDMPWYRNNNYQSHVLDVEERKFNQQKLINPST